ncbi:glycosyltransferase family 4 protein [Stutzerimonas stutzeri]|uniref:Glycosyltransferase n=1 Tax=Stutzerimonas stutzeri TaxID=316 RepID=A0A6I6LW12_STUST|nr:glycosyltransferase family 4 protein [Stutzerimonas stutzeri]QGZ30561.1 glycosyltransferase [Stutzerimonas stutzeri]
MDDKKLLIVTTVPETFLTILDGQSGFLNKHFSVSLATSPTQGFEQLKSCEGVPVYPLLMKRGISPFRDVHSLLLMILLIRRLRPDVVHSYTPKAGLISMLAARLCSVPTRVHTFTGLIFPTRVGISQRILISIDRLICSCATKIVPESNGVKKDLVKFAVTNKELNVIGNGNIAGVDVGYFNRGAVGVSSAANVMRNALNISSSDFVFCYVGRLNKDKGVAELVKAFASQPDNARLIIVGGLDESAPVSSETLRIIEADKRIHMLGFQVDVRPILYLADILVLPSYREGFPNVILQAGAMELPVIASDISGCNEVIESFKNGWLIPPKDIVALAEAMQVAINTPRNIREHMGAFARNIIENKFERRAHWNRMLGFYKEQIEL